MAPKPEAPSPEVPPPFHVSLAMFEGGVLSADLADQLRDLNASLSEMAAQGKKAKGSLTLKLDLSMENGVLEVRADVKSVLPKMSREKSMFWLTPGNNLSQSNPKQVQMFPRKLDVSEPRRVDAQEG